MNCFQRFLLKIVKIVYPCEVIGKENVVEGSAIMASNHFSFADVFYLLYVYDKDIGFVAKKELFEKKFANKFLKWCGGFPIDRNNPDIKSLLNVIKFLKNGHKLVIFVEGTRNKTGNYRPLPIKGGSVIFAIKSKTPIIPVMMVKKARIFRKNHIIVGKPFELSEFYDKKINDEQMALMEKTLYDKMIETQDELIKILQDRKNKKRLKKHKASKNPPISNNGEIE